MNWIIVLRRSITRGDRVSITIPGLIGTPTDTDLATDLVNIQSAVDGLNDFDYTTELVTADIFSISGSQAAAMSSQSKAASQTPESLQNSQSEQTMTGGWWRGRPFSPITTEP